MPVDPELAHYRAQKAGRTRWGGDTQTPAAELERAQTDRLVSEVERRAPNFSPEQIAVLRRVFKYGPPSEEGATG
jgi:hypothetical protein